MSEKLSVRVESSIAAIPAATWDACAYGAPLEAASKKSAKPLRGLADSARDQSTHEELESKSEQAALSEPVPDRHNPFISHAFLSSLEESGCVSARSGWAPQHLLVEDATGAVLAAMPCYLKNHSRGEYVFDHGWAEAFEHAGGHYYPKLQVSVPFTPVTGPRLLVRPGPKMESARAALVAGALQLCKRREASSLHVTFAPESEWKYLTKLGLLARNDCQFHWINGGYASFEDFLAALSSRKRKLVKRERREAVDGVEIVRLTGKELTESAWDAFFAFYMDTGARKWGQPYLNRAFFSIAASKMADKIVLVLAKRGGRYVAGALNFLGENTIYGRYWGTTESRPFLHFEVCYYQAIEYAIEHKLARVEAGAQGPHKLARGYMPVTTYSAHWIADPGLRRAVADYLARERVHVATESEELAALGPFRKDAAI
jgi:predicted N-acyltransferase